MIWYTLALILFLIALLLLIVTRVRDQRYLRRKTSEVMNPEILDEVQQEEEAVRARHQRFREVLEQAKNRAND